jgi:hypothetical protein
MSKDEAEALARIEHKVDEIDRTLRGDGNIGGLVSRVAALEANANGRTALVAAVISALSAIAVGAMYAIAKLK